MKHLNLAFAGVVAGSLALSAQAGVSTWWSESFSSTDYADIHAMTNSYTKGTWTMAEGDTSSLFVGAYSNEVASAYTNPNDVLVLNTEGNELTFAPTNATAVSGVTVVDADVFFVGSESPPSFKDTDTDIQFAMYLQVPEDGGANAVMVYVRDQGNAGWVALDGTSTIADKTWHHVQVKINYADDNGRKVSVFIGGEEKTPSGGLTIANGSTTASRLTSVSFRGTGAVDNFAGGWETVDPLPHHTFTASAFVDGVLDPTVEIGAVSDTQAGTGAEFFVNRTVETKTIAKIVVKGFEGASDTEYTVTDDGTDFTVTPSGLTYLADVSEISITVPTDNAATTGAAKTYPALEVWYATPAPPTYSASITLPQGCTLTGVTVNGTPVTAATTIEGLNDDDVVVFTYENADGVTKTATATIDGANATATTEAYTWADYLGAAVDGAYEIDNLAELKLFQKGIPSSTNEVKLATAGVTFKLTADITLDEAWPGVGVQNGKDIYGTADFNAAAFQGTFDGQNHTISGFQMIGGGLDYCGFFNSAYGATIQNLKIAYAGSLFAADTTSSTKESGATFVGVAKNSTLRNLTTVAGTVSCSKGFGGIVGFLTSGTSVDSCTNNLNMTSLAKNKCGGIAMITQGGSAVTISNCQNNGTQTTSSSNSEYGAIVGYVGLDTTIANCETTVGRFLKHQDHTVTLQGVNKGDAGVLAYHGAATPGLNFAMVDGNVATFVADTALAAGNTYKVLGPSATATYEFAAAGSISFDTVLATPTYAITAPGMVLSSSTSGTVTTYTAVDNTWTMVPVTTGATVSGNTASYANLTVPYSAVDASIGRAWVAAWVGVNVIAPDSVTAENISKIKYNRTGNACQDGLFGGSDARTGSSFASNNDGMINGHYYIGVWVPLSAASVRALIAGETTVYREYSFYNEDDPSATQTFRVEISPQNIVLTNPNSVEGAEEITVVDWVEQAEPQPGEPPAVDPGDGLAAYNEAYGTAVAPIEVTSSAFKVNFVATVPGTYVLMAATTVDGNYAETEVTKTVTAAQIGTEDALVTLEDKNTTAPAKFYKIGWEE